MSKAIARKTVHIKITNPDRQQQITEAAETYHLHGQAYAVIKKEVEAAKKILVATAASVETVPGLCRVVSGSIKYQIHTNAHRAPLPHICPECGAEGTIGVRKVFQADTLSLAVQK